MGLRVTNKVESGGMSRGPGKLQVVAAGVSGYVESFSDDIDSFQ